MQGIYDPQSTLPGDRPSAGVLKQQRHSQKPPKPWTGIWPPPLPTVHLGKLFNLSRAASSSLEWGGDSAPFSMWWENERRCKGFWQHLWQVENLIKVTAMVSKRRTRCCRTQDQKTKEARLDLSWWVPDAQSWLLSPADSRREKERQAVFQRGGNLRIASSQALSIQLH